jgi:hypothetical protein
VSSVTHGRTFHIPIHKNIGVPVSNNFMIWSHGPFDLPARTTWTIKSLWIQPAGKGLELMADSGQIFSWDELHAHGLYLMQ